MQTKKDDAIHTKQKKITILLSQVNSLMNSQGYYTQPPPVPPYESGLEYSNSRPLSE